MRRLMFGCVAVAGIGLGVWFFIRRKRPDSTAYRNADGMTRQLLLVAVLVSSLLSSAVSQAQERFGTNSTPAASAPLNPDGLEQLTQSQEWQDLKVIWNLITKDPQLLESVKGKYYGNGLLCRYVIHLKLSAIREKGYLSKDETAALESVFGELAAATLSSRDGLMRCYFSGPPMVVQCQEPIVTQMELLRKQGREGTLSDEVVEIAQETLRTKLQILDLLATSGFSYELNTALRNRANRWQADGKFNFQNRASYYGEILDEIICEDPFMIDERQRQQLAIWRNGESRLSRLIVGFSRSSGSDGSDAILGQITTGIGLNVGEMESYIRNYNHANRDQLIPVYAKLAGKEAVPLLTELLQDEEIMLSGDNVCFPVRIAASEALTKTIRFSRIQKFELSVSGSAGISAIQSALKSEHLSVRKSALWPAGMSRNVSMIPLLAEIAKNDPSLSDGVVGALGCIGDSSGLPIIFEIAGKGTVSSSTIYGALTEIGGSDALAFLEQEVVSTNAVDDQIKALWYLSRFKRGGAESIFLKATEPQYDPYVRVSAASYFPKTRKAVSVAMELVTSDDFDIRWSAFKILTQADDEESFQLLEKLSKDERYSKEALEALSERRKRAEEKK